MFKEKIELFKLNFGIVIMLILVLFSGLFFSLARDINESDCQIIACTYKDYIVPVINTTGIFLFLPPFLFWYLGLLNPFFVWFSLILVPLYWILIIFLLDRLIVLLSKRKKITMKSKGDRFFISFLISFTMIFAIFLGIVSFLYYPRINADYRFDQYLLIATATVAIAAFILNFYKSKSIEIIKFKNKVKKLTELTLLSLIMGTFISFMTNYNINTNNNLLDLAMLSSIKIALMAAGILGLTNILFILIGKVNSKSKTP